MKLTDLSYYLNMACSLSILIAAVIAWWRFKKIHQVFRPFIYCIWLGVFNEIISYGFLIPVFHNTAPNGNIYVLLEALLLLWQFKNWGLFKTYPLIFRSLVVFTVLIWITEVFIISNLFTVSSYFRIVYSFIIVLLSINLLNRHIIQEKTMLLKDSIGLICLAFIIFYTYKVMLEEFFLYGLYSSKPFAIKTFFIFSFINLFCNLIYALAVLWMPTKQRFSLPY